MKQVRARLYSIRLLAAFCAGWVLFLAGGFGAASTAHAQQATLPEGMVDSIWVLMAVERAPQQNVGQTFGMGVTIEFNADGTATGSGGCNDFNATYTVGAGNSITFGPVASTKKFCSPDAVMNLESEFFTALSSVTSYTLDQSDLSLTYNNGQSRLDFVFIGAIGSGVGMPRTGGGDALPMLVLFATASMLCILTGLLLKRHTSRNSA